MSTVLPESSVGLPVHDNSMLCDVCGRLSRDNDDSCWRCGEDARGPISHIGQIYSYTTVRAGEHSFVLALVELLCGRLVTARIIDVEHELKIGLAVEFKPELSLTAPSGGLFFSPLATR